MKTFLIILSILAVLFIIFQAYTTMATNKSEEQPYKVIKTEKDFEIRFYPSVTMATITSSAKSYKELGSSGFNKLAGYIFGGNDAKKQIAMTSPVHMDISDSISSMSFVMPSTYNAENLPKPNDAAVNINKTADAYVAAIKFSGFASDNDIKNQTETLKNALKAASISYYGNFRYLGYNPPYQLVGRRNEVIIDVNWDAK
jgi:SOUL heme-binding protein